MWGGARGLAGRGVVLAGGLLCWLVLAPAAWAVGDLTTTAACSNEASPGFSVFLPECRGYELVSPVFKDGNELGANYLDDVSEAGSRMIVNSLGVFAGSDSDTGSTGSEYQLARSESGWLVSALSPPASAFPAQTLLAATPDLGETLWFARSPSESIATENLYVREGDGTMVEIAPVLPPAVTSGPPSAESNRFQFYRDLKYLAASDDLSHVLVELTVPL